MSMEGSRIYWMMVALLMVPLLSGGCSNSAEPPSQQPAPQPAAQLTQAAQQSHDEITQSEKAANLGACREKLKKAAQLDLLTDMGFDGASPHLAVGSTWDRIDFSAKEGLAKTAACFFLAGDTSKAIRFNIKSGKTGRIVATWNYTKLEVE